MIEVDRRATVTSGVSAAVVLGLEPFDTGLSLGDYECAMERLARSLRPWDVVVPLGPRTVGVLCSALGSSREVDAVAQRLADMLRAPMAVGTEIHQIGVCVGSSVRADGEDDAPALDRATEAMRQMSTARDNLVVPLPRGNET